MVAGLRATVIGKKFHSIKKITRGGIKNLKIYCKKKFNKSFGNPNIFGITPFQQIRLPKFCKMYYLQCIKFNLRNVENPSAGKSSDPVNIMCSSK